VSIRCCAHYCASPRGMLLAPTLALSDAVSHELGVSQNTPVDGDPSWLERR
jgi:hypothetical protein